MEEIWKNVEGFDGDYIVSNYGNIISLRQCKKGKLLTPYNSYGYLMVHLFKYPISKRLKVHRVVALAFLSNPENKPQVNHINGIKHDNRLENLEWNTSFENQRHAVITGLKTGLKGEKCSFYGLKGGLNFKCKKVINIKTNQIYDCAKDVSDFLKYSHISFIKQLNGYTVNKTDYRYINS